MDRILRSVIQVSGVPEADDALGNWNKLKENDLEYRTREDKAIYSYLNTFYGEMSAPPDFDLVKEYF